MKIINKKNLRKSLLFFSSILFIGCACFLIYYLGIQPYYSKQIQNKYKEIYYSSSQQYQTNSAVVETTFNSLSQQQEGENQETTTSLSIKLDSIKEKGAKNSDGILLKFETLLKYNDEVKGWLSIPGTNIDYPVLQSMAEPEYYLKRDFEGNIDKNGSLYLDNYCNVESSKNLVIHGHNMESTKMMFYELPQYKNLDFYKTHPVITFDSIFEESQWKVIAFMRVSGNFSSAGSFNYIQGDFESDEAFLDFVYQVQLRSSYYCPVDINENDSLLMLSTCTYEIDNFRSVVVARKIRPNESVEVETDTAYYKKNVLYPDRWYTQYGGKPPVVTTFMDAMSFDEINWYDGELEVDSAIGTTIEFEAAQYEVTSSSTLKYIKPLDKKVTDVNIPSDVAINNRPFDVTEMSKDAFKQSTKLKNVKIGNNIAEIPSKAFMNCEKLESVTIGDSVEVIGMKAFYKLSSLKNIKFNSECIEEIGEKAFDKINKKAKIKFSKEKFKDYRKLLQKSGLPEYVKFE